MKTCIGLIAHDKKKDAMVAFASRYADYLGRCNIVATGTTGQRLSDEVGLPDDKKLSRPLGADLQIGSLPVEGKVDCAISLRDPMTTREHEPDINAQVHACDMHNIPCAINIAPADTLLPHLGTTTIP